MRTLALLGATGSIGASTLDVVARHPDRFRIGALAAHRNVDALATLCARFRPGLAVIADASCAGDLRERLRALDVHCRVEAGPQALLEAATDVACDTVVAAIVGAAGLESTLAAARAGKRVLLANKEAIVMAGALLDAALAGGGGELLPLDSEHNAVFQCLPRGGASAEAGVRRILLTASGGPFRGCTTAELEKVTPDRACAHPKWRMGRKISVDSATLMNKGLEVIEAHHLFGLPASRIDVVVHPQSIVHSLVEYVDGSVLAQLGNPDMRTAIAHALAWPQRVEAGVEALDLLQVARLEFEAPDRDTFRCLDLAYAALASGGSAPTVLNAANEEAVAAFLEQRLAFTAIAEAIERCLDAVDSRPVDDLDAILDADLTARREARRIIATLPGPRSPP